MNKLKFASLEKLLEMIANKEKFHLVDVLSAESFRDGHIPGAINMPVDLIPQQAKAKLIKTDTIVVYCASYSCTASTQAARAFLDMGFEKVLDFKGGKKAWVNAGLALEK